MDINDVKALIRSILITSNVPYSIPKLLRDFEEEAGIRMPIFKFNSAKAFLRSLTDTVQIVGEPPFEKVRAVTNEKVKHISSLIKRQGKMRFHKYAYSHPDQFLSQNPFNEQDTIVPETPKSNGQSKSKVSNNKEDNPGTVKSKEYFNVEKYDDFIFKEDEINSISKRPGLDPGLKLISPSKPSNCDNISESGSVTSSNSSSKSYYVTEGVKKKLKDLMKKQTQGIWCCDLPDLYKESYESALEFKEFGYRSLIDMVMELSEIFRYVRPGNGDWLLFDASKPPSQEEIDTRTVSLCRIPENVEKNLFELIESHCEDGTKPGVYLDDLLVLYFKKFRKRLNFSELGFPNIKTLLTKLDGQILRLETEGSRVIIKPCVEKNVTKQATALLPITPDDDVFTELFPDDVVKQGENYAKLKIEDYFRVGEKINVNVADVWSPDKFYMQLKEFEEEFFNLNENLQQFYNSKENKYKMLDATVQPNQVCVALFNNGEGVKEWNRSVIVRRTKTNEVLVYFVDYGNKVKMDVGKLRFLHRDFFNLPAQSFHARLSSVRPPKDNVWPLETCETFLRLVTVPIAEFHVTSIDFEAEKISGDILAISGNKRVNVGLLLIRDGMAVSEDTKQVADSTLSRNKPEEKSPPPEKCVPQEIKRDELPSEPVENITSTNNNNNNSKSSEESITDSQGKHDTFPVHNIVDVKTHAVPPGLVKMPESLTLNNNAPVPNICITNVNMVPALNRERDVYALAFWVISTNEFVKTVAQLNLDNGLQLALNLAQNLSGMTEVTCVNWK